MNPSHRAIALTLVLLAGAGVTALPTGGAVEVLHFWTSDGEARAVAQLKKTMESKGHVWKDFAVAGGGGDNAATVLKSRVVAGNPPAAAQITGPAIQEWAAEGVLANIDSVARAEKWETLLPGVVADAVKYKGSYVAVPVDVHRVNWLWANAAVLKKAGVDRMPRTWAEFFAAADQVRKTGVIPLAHGGQSWQDFTTFESVVLGVGGARFYQDALVRLDPVALGGETMKQSLETFRRIKGYTDAAAPGRDWNLATAMVTQGEAAFQFMGDWAKVEFVASGKKPGRDFLCAAVPGSATSFTFKVDSFAMFKLQGASAQQAQEDLAEAIMDTRFQEVFNRNKGSIPVRLNTNMRSFDVCARLSAKDFAEADKSGALLPSIAHGMAVPQAVEGAMKDAVSQFWNDERVSIADAMRNIALAAQVK